MKNKNRTEGPRRGLYLEILRQDFPYELHLDSDGKDRLQAAKELIDEDFIRGEPVLRASDKGGYELINVWVYEVKFKGRMFADEQDRLIYEQSFRGRCLRYAGPFIGWLAGILSGLLIAYFKKG